MRGDALARARPRRATAAVRHAGDDDLPAAVLSPAPAVSSATRPGRDQLAFRENADAAAEQLGVRQDVRAEENRPALVAQLQDQLAHVAAADRIETRHRLVEDDELGIVDERLREPDALHHALRVLAQRPAAVGAEADQVEHAAARARRSAAA